MNKKTCLIIAVLLMVSAVPSSYADRSEKGPIGRSGEVFARGVMNFAGLPAEIYSTAVRESKEHSKLWPVTYVPSLLTNIVVRAASSVNDILIYPLFQAPFSSDIKPITEPMGLPDYPWQTSKL